MEYKKLDVKDIEFLKSVVEQERVYTGGDINEDYSMMNLAE